MKYLKLLLLVLMAVSCSGQEKKDAPTSAEMMRGLCALAFCAAIYKSSSIIYSSIQIIYNTDTHPHFALVHTCASEELSP